ncbi:MAG: diaminopimelate epimerase [Planctomycetaceae bacterium]|nr:diaminopimelate epimerase [Planctomycetaceae bacterium]
MRFTKMHGAGNDYVYVDCFADPLPGDPAELARQMSHRHFGVGGDGLILIRPTEKADARMQMFNADGSEAEMCGNGLRCVAKYVYDHGICSKDSMQIETGAGILAIDIEATSGTAQRVRVDMGEPVLDPATIPTRLAGNPVVNAELIIDGQTFQATSVSMGNPHCIIFVEEATDDLVLGDGPKIEAHEMFPAKVNVEFVEVISPTEVRQRTWERGSGETWACGTGASAVCVAGVLSGRTERRILNHLLGGDLELEWNNADNHVFMTGSASEVFTGEWPLH